MFSILGSHSVGRKHKLVTAGSESTLFFSMNKLVPSLKSRLLKTHTHIELKKKKNLEETAVLWKTSHFRFEHRYWF